MWHSLSAQRDRFLSVRQTRIEPSYQQTMQPSTWEAGGSAPAIECSLRNEIKVGVRIWLFAKMKVPPFLLVRLEQHVNAVR
jgi:hypothetical protein